jgi:hypothetical protein
VNRFSKSSTPKELFWRTEKKKEERGKIFFELLEGEEEGRELVTQYGTNLYKSVTLNFVFVT